MFSTLGAAEEPKMTLRWHPDKFSQTFGPHLHPDHQDRILDRVNAITSGVNWLRKSMS
jgi:hypothetical protein